MILFLPEEPHHLPAVETLLDACFGHDRYNKPVYALRRTLVPLPELCFIALVDGELKASIRFWRIAAGDQPALLLGPLGVDPARRGQGMGRALVRMGLAKAEELGFALCFLTGDATYYRQFGFETVDPAVWLKGEESARLLGLALKPGALNGVSGELHAGRWVRPEVKPALADPGLSVLAS
ncbi:MAG: GNAT family N-acetyltransferase [Geminicoccaceae bacterium]